MATHLQSAELRRGSRRQPEASRNSILQAALAEFAREGLAGARMDAIAEAAGVNKALLYYYFQDKETLYGSILDSFFERLCERIMAVCDQPGSAGERFLAYVRTHYDSIAESPYYAHIFMSELMSASRGGSPHLDRIFERYMRPIAGRVLGLVEEGVKRREFRAVDPNQFVPSALGSIIHYFLTAPLRQKFMPEIDFSSPKAIQQRRAAVLDFIAAALFAKREAGIKLAAKIAARSTAGQRRMLEPSDIGRGRQQRRSRSLEEKNATRPRQQYESPHTRPEAGSPVRAAFARSGVAEGTAQLSPAQGRESGRSAGYRAYEGSSPVGTAHAFRANKHSAIHHRKGKHP